MTESNDLPSLYAVETERLRLNDLFFSRTDERGVIISGNTPLHQVAAFSRSELNGQPHKILRHPDMPKGLFHLLWDALKSNRAIGGYIMNMAKDEACYWVYAILVPVEGAFLSIQMKPSNEMFEKVRSLYERLSLAEQAGERTTEESAADLVHAVQGMGFDDYHHFMSVALSQEFASRSVGLGAEQARAIQSFEAITKSVGYIEEAGTKVASLFSRTEQIPYNMRLQAGRLEGSDGPISVISENHRQMSQSLTASVGDFRSAAALGTAPVRDAVFEIGMISLIDEMIDLMAFDSEVTREDKAMDLNALHEVKSHYTRKARSAVSDIALRVTQFARMCKDMRRMLSGLEMTRIMCKIERSKATGDTEGLDEIVNRLLMAEQDIGAVMTEIENAIRDILDASEHLMRSALSSAKPESLQRLSA